MSRFAFYGRVSTEDQQDPTSSKNWQLSRSTSLIEPHGGEIVAEFFDIGQSRSLPWKRRPQAASLLKALANPKRGFDAVVIGEPARAFYGNQFGLTFPVFTHYGVELWVPEVGGRIEPDSDAHDLVMSLYGGMSKGERNRIKIRVRSAMASQTRTEGRFLGGRPPYGYKIIDAGVHPNPGKAALGLRQHRLGVDPVTGPVVQGIFNDWVSGKGLHLIAEELTKNGIPCPSAYDRKRNQHREGDAWAKSAIRAILSNPRYTGHQVWNKQRRDEVLLDVEDVALGHHTVLRWNDSKDWVWSDNLMHEALVTMDEFEQAQEHLQVNRLRKSERRGKRANNGPYLLSGLVRCGVCKRKMHGSWNHDTARYRCQYPSQYALAKGIEHPKTIYIKEDDLTPILDAWISTTFSPENADSTFEAIAAAITDTTAEVLRAQSLRDKIKDCDKRLDKYRVALDAGADAEVVIGWLHDVRRERTALELKLADIPPAPTATPDDLRALIKDMEAVVNALSAADPEERTAVYRALAMEVTYDPYNKKLFVTADLGKHGSSRVDKSVSARGLEPPRGCPH